MSPPVPPEVQQLARQLKSFAAAGNTTSHILSDYARQIIDYLVPNSSEESYPSGWTNPRIFRGVVSGFEAHIDHLGINLEPHEADEEEVDLIPTSVTQRRKSRKSFFNTIPEGPHETATPLTPALTNPRPRSQTHSQSTSPPPRSLSKPSLT
jgi:hypothetical protein